MAAAAIILPPTPTPEGYHRIVSPTLSIPSNKTISVPVGLLACQRDPLLRQLSTVIVSASLPDARPQTAKKNKKAATDIDGSVFHVVLHDTILFPEGGGQPSDIGFIVFADGKSWQVTEVKRVGGQAIHSVQPTTGTAIEDALGAFSIGAEITVCLGEDGFKRRLDHMTLHTSQHLLSAILEQQLNLPTLSWSLTAYPSPCYVEVPRGMTQEEIVSIQEETNRLVFEGRKVYIEVEELHADNVPGVVRLENGRSAGKALPSDYTGGVKRTVIIEGVDRNPCCGTHMPTLHNLQLFLIPHTDALSRSTTASARLYFLAGPRLITYLSSTNTLLAEASSILSCGPTLVPDRTNQVIEERRKAEKRVNDLEAELAELLSGQLVNLAEASDETRFVMHKHRNDDTLGFLSAIAQGFTDQLSENSKPYLLVLSSSPTSQTSSSTSIVVIFGSEEKVVKEVGDALKAKIGVKGGGKGNKWSGKFTGVWKDLKEGAGIKGVLQGYKQ